MSSGDLDTKTFPVGHEVGQWILSLFWMEKGQISFIIQNEDTKNFSRIQNSLHCKGPSSGTKIFHTLFQSQGVRRLGFGENIIV